MGKDRYVAYVGTYTHGSSVGVHVYDMDVEAGYMTERNVVPVNNASHLTTSTNGKYLYSIADEGVEVLKINQKTGDLTAINKVGIDGMRGCFLSRRHLEKASSGKAALLRFLRILLRPVKREPAWWQRPFCQRKDKHSHRRAEF